ncbi:unnamed protein product [Debaryomyces tyrocola]|nr:unnamed protein product [Debaryomyces tyrocola]
MATQHQRNLYLLSHSSQYTSLIHSKVDLESVLFVPSAFISRIEFDFSVPFFQQMQWPLDFNNCIRI